MPEQKTFAQQAILNRIAEKSATQRGKQFQDYQHTDYEAYHNYSDAWHQFVNAQGEPEDDDYCELHGDYYDYEVGDDKVTHSYSDVFYDDCAVDVPQSNKLAQTPNFFQKVVKYILGQRRK